MTADVTKIEIYLWEPHDPRPGTARRASDHVLAVATWPVDTHPPLTGDVIVLSSAGEHPKPYRVVSREHLLCQPGPDDPSADQQWSKMWIHVEMISDEEYQNARR